VILFEVSLKKHTINLNFFSTKKKTKIIGDASKPIEFLGFEIMESKKYKFTERQKEKRKIIIRPNRKKKY